MCVAMAQVVELVTGLAKSLGLGLETVGWVRVQPSGGD